MIGKTLSHYEILSKIGEGGMGEVWRARDTRLDRDVALKVLPAAFVSDADRLGRFEREARVLASLNHPNIAAIHDVGESDGHHFLVMEMVTGETLAERLAQGPVPLAEALTLTRQIADGLASAHDRGIVHRDLKPANVKVDDAGRVKILDFGLARAWSGDPVDTGSSQSPTQAALTEAGVILGTAAYMSPEQARGKAVDQRADVWALGVILHEMLTGRRLFEGESLSDILAAVLTRDIDFDALPASTPPRVRRALEACLRRDAASRLHHVGDLDLLLEEPDTSQPEPGRGFGRLAIVGLGLAALLVGFGLGWMRPVERSQGAKGISLHATILEPRLDRSGTFRFTPDGSHIIFQVQNEGQTQIAIRALGSPRAEMLPGTEGGTNPFPSPDGRWIGYLQRQRLMKIPVDGGDPVLIADFGNQLHFDPFAPGAAPTADWGPDGTIVVSVGLHRDIADRPGLFIVDAASGELRVLARKDTSLRETAMQVPRFTPDGRWILFSTMASGDEWGVWGIRPDGSDRRLILEEHDSPLLTADGLLLASSSAVMPDRSSAVLALMAYRIDPASLEGAGRPVPLTRELSDEASMSYDVSADGTLLFLGFTGTSRGYRLVRIDRQGAQNVLPIRAIGWLQPQVSADGSRIVVRELSQFCQLWEYDTRRSLLRRVSREDLDLHNPILSPDGNRVASSIEDSATGDDDQFRQIGILDLDDGDLQMMPDSSPHPRYPVSWHGSTLLFTEAHPDNDMDIWAYDLVSQQLQAVATTPAQELGAAISPDGRWLAWDSDEGGSTEIYVRRWPDGGARQQVSVGGGRGPDWASDGSRIVYQNGTRLMEVAVTNIDGSLQLGTPTPFPTRELVNEGWKNFAPLPGGDAFLTTIPVDSSQSELHIVTSFRARLDDRQP